MIEMNVGGRYYRLVEDTDLTIHMNNYFSAYFDTYLQKHYGITEGTFRNVIKTLAPEEFI